MAKYAEICTKTGKVIPPKPTEKFYCDCDRECEYYNDDIFDVELSEDDAVQASKKLQQEGYDEIFVKSFPDSLGGCETQTTWRCGDCLKDW